MFLFSNCWGLGQPLKQIGTAGGSVMHSSHRHYRNLYGRFVMADKNMTLSSSKEPVFIALLANSSRQDTFMHLQTLQEEPNPCLEHGQCRL